MQTVFSLFVGSLLGYGMIRIARRYDEDRSRYLFAAGLVVAAAIYAAFSMNAGPAEWVVVELAGVAVFAAAAVTGYKKSIVVLAAGWLLHIGWDVMHELNDSVRFMPAWYPALCVAFDIVVGGYLLTSWRRVQTAKSR